MQSAGRTIGRRVVVGGRGVARTGRQVRFQSTQQTVSSASSNNSHLIAGLAGGGVTLLGAYGYYHLSGIKQVVDSTKSVHQTLKSAAQTAVEKTPSPNEALKFLRSTAKSYAGLIPGASAYVDSSFDTLDQLSETHGEEVNKIVQKTYEDIRAVLQKGGMDAKTATQIYEILQKQGSELAELAKEAGMDVLEKHPELKEKLGGGWEELQRLTKDAGDSEAAQQAKKIKDETVKAVQDIFQKGISAESIIKAKELIETKTKEVRELSEKVARDAWKKGMEQYQDKMPENVKSFLSNSDTITGLVSGGGATATVAAVIGKVKELASKKGGFNDQSFEELKKFVEGKVQDGKQKGSIGLDAAWKTVESWLGSVPGGKQALEKAGDIDVSSLSSIAQGRGEDAQKLAQETYSDLLKVLKEKSEKAKKLAQKTKDEAKEKA